MRVLVAHPQSSAEFQVRRGWLPLPLPLFKIELFKIAFTTGVSGSTFPTFRDLGMTIPAEKIAQKPQIASRLRFALPLFVIAAMLLFSSAAHAQNPQQKNEPPVSVKSPPAAAVSPTPGVPDLSGVWDTQHLGGLQAISSTFQGEIPPMTPWATERYLATRPSLGPRAVADSTDPVYPTKLGAPGCFPPGVPRIYLQVFPMEIIQLPGRVIMRFEFDHNLREIWTDGRAHAADLNPSYMGDAIGKWEGDALVVDTIGFNDKTWLDREGRRHSDELHVTERIRRPTHGTLQDDIVMDDPKSFTKPWKARVTFELRPNWGILEHTCADYVNFDEVLEMQGQTK
jgi:hypothetical protein